MKSPKIKPQFKTALDFLSLSTPCYIIVEKAIAELMSGALSKPIAIACLQVCPALRSLVF